MKEEIGGNYIRDWLNRTNDYQPAKKRRAIIVGSDKESNIGAGIAQVLNGFNQITEYGIEEVDVRYPKTYPDMHKVDTLIITAGISHLDWFEDQSDEWIENTIATNLIGPLKLVRRFIHDSVERRCLKYVVVIGSMAYKSVLNASLPYCASKAGLAHAVRCLGWELAPKGYRVYGVHPSNTEGTPMTAETIDGIQRYRHVNREQAEAYWAAIRVMPEWLKTNNIGATVNWLVSGQADFLTGTNIELSGGQR